MHLHEYFLNLTPYEREDYAKRSVTSVDYIWQVARGHRNASTKLSIRLSNESGGRVKKYELRPDVWPAPKRRQKAK